MVGMEKTLINTDIERPFLLPKEAIDTINSMCWFLADAFWMLGATHVAHFFLFPTIVSGLCLLYVEKRRPVFFINLAINSWIWMNTLWMLAEVKGSPTMMWGPRACFVLGLAFVACAVATSASLRDTFSHFRRFRVLKWN